MESIAQRLMRSRVLPEIYERLWRPALIGLAKGPLGPTTAQEMALLRSMLAAGPGMRILDVACGPGNTTRALASGVRPGGLVVGLDASPTMLARAARDTPPGDRVAFVLADVLDLPFPPRTFDAVSCFAALYLFDRPFDALDAMALALKPGGRLAVLTTRRVPGLGRLNDVFGALGGIRMFGDREVTEALAKRGFTGIRQRRTSLMQFVSAVR
ncbi:class I SAM-dependent methyltransferase [Nonomuraea sp. NN258]|uniref:class I SAM-dependent methyltransferase n=1 Tax=Nonomuraea antri TaxID=2730852 RepID=UPI001569B54F|nr:class I SAM-dependent methyltransferase [Nonomuraea antri]NRQ34454.1 class I SAM-dependent methyltransferase [Nonomuraea antri]